MEINYLEVDYDEREFCEAYLRSKLLKAAEYADGHGFTGETRSHYIAGFVFGPIGKSLFDGPKE